MDFLFWLVYITLYYTFRIFFRHIYISGKENIPKDKPVLLASNHSNSFLDGVVLHKTLNRIMKVFVRGDVFNHPVANKALRQMRLFPIFRMRDARNNPKLASKKNAESMDEAFRYFEKKYAVLIFSEAAASMAKTLLPIKKGTASIALDMESRSKRTFDLHIVPTGVNYTFFKGLRKDVIVQYGKPIRVQDYMDDWENNPSETVNQLTADVEHAMREQIICLERKDQLAESEMLLEVARNEIKHHPLLQHRKKQERFNMEKSAAKMANEVFKEENRESSAAKAANRYIDLLRDHGLKDIGFARFYFPVFKVILSVLLFPFALVGLLSNGLCWLISWKLADKLTKNSAFYDSIHLGIQMATALLLSIGFLILTAFLFGLGQAVLMLTGILLCGVTAVIWFDVVSELHARAKAQLMKLSQPESYRNTVQARLHLVAFFGQYDGGN